MTIQRGPFISRLFNRNAVWQNLVSLFCVLFGLALIANTQLAADGGWIWYAILLRGGHKLYSELRLPLQPLFVLDTELFLALLGKSWIATRVPAVLNLIAYCLGFRLLVHYLPFSDRRKALFLGCGFSIAVCSNLVRFDDYHVITDFLCLFSLVLLLMLRQAATPSRRLVLIVCMGVFSGLSFTNRINDGGALLVGVALCIFVLLPSRRLLSLAVLLAAAAVTVVLVVRLTGDSFHDYWTVSVFRAAGSKGGAGHVFQYPVKLLWTTTKLALKRLPIELILYPFVLGAAWGFLLKPWLRSGQKNNFWKAALVILILLPPTIHLLPFLINNIFIYRFSTVATFALYALGAVAFYKLLRWDLLPGHRHPWNRLEILFVIPLGQLMSVATSSGGIHSENYLPMALMILLLPIVHPFKIRSEAIKSTLTVVLLFLLCYGFVDKTMIPYEWHSYRSLPLFVHRQWYRHPIYGPMIIETDLLHFIQPVCAQFDTDHASLELLSIPYSYANYFCGIPPWNNYVQTFFDTTSKETMDELMAKLRQSPPQWLLYERQMDSLRIHELTYNGGKPLPHRFLDTMIEEKIQSGAWKVVYTSDMGSTPSESNKWLLIRTQP